MNREIEIVAPEKIEARSFEIIGEELNNKGIKIDKDKEFIIKRAIHTTADFDYAYSLRFSDGVINIMADLIKKGCIIVTDTNMALSGINKTELAKWGSKAICFMADEEVAKEAKLRGVTRATVSMERAMATGKPTIFVVGNAPTALITLHDMYEKNEYKPAFVIGVPVGFVNVVAAKELILGSDIPYIINQGRKGGSNVAAAIVNAILYMMR